MKHCGTCLDTFEDYATTCKDCELPLCEGEPPPSAEMLKAQQRLAPLLAFRNESEAMSALAKLDGAGIEGQIVPLGSAGLGAETEGASTGVPVAVPEGDREEALRILAENDPEDAEILGHYSDFLDEQEPLPEENWEPIAPSAAPERLGPVPKYGNPWAYAVALRVCAILTWLIASCAIAEDVSSAFGLGELQMVWAYSVSPTATCVLLIAMREWLSVIDRNIHAFLRMGVEPRTVLGGFLRPLLGLEGILVMLEGLRGQRVVAGWLHLTPLGLLLFFVIDRFAIWYGRMDHSDLALSFAMLAHGLLCLLSGCALWMSFRIGAAHREIARRWSGP